MRLTWRRLNSKGRGSNMKTLISLLLAAMMATAAFAGLDPEPDSFGIYFDLAGNFNMKCSGLTAVSTSMYILLMNPTTQIMGFELAYEVEPFPTIAPFFAEDFVRTSQVIDGTGFVDNGNSSDPLLGDFRCGYATPRPAVPAMLMVTWQVRFYGVWDDGIFFYLKGVLSNPSLGANGFPVVDGGPGIGWRPAGISSGELYFPVACTGEGSYRCSVSEEVSSFGSVKSLFR